MTDGARDRLGRAQAALVAALVLGGPVPAGFHSERVRATAEALVHKRAGAVAQRWPLLAHALGADFLPVAGALLAPLPPGGPLRDGWHVARTLRDEGRLPPGVLAELLAVEAVYRQDGNLRPRRGMTVRIGRDGGRWVVVLRAGRRLLRMG